jgi:preprotein translocase subunit SecA
MTGTAAEVKKELKSVYGLNVFRVLPAQVSQKKYLPTEFCATESDKWHRVVARVKTLHASGRPVLVGTKSLKASLQVSQLLTQQGLTHQLLNAQHHEDEAHIVARAGELGCITVATNMAGRGTDIKLPAEVKQLGGLYVLATERHESRRIDRQLYGRCGRQGDPGTVEVILSLTDELMARHAPGLLRQLANMMNKSSSRASRRLQEILFTLSQQLVERRQQAARNKVLKIDEHYANMLAFSGRTE